MKSLTRIISVILLNYILFASFSCSETPPQLIEDRWLLVDQVNVHGKKDHEELIFFIHAEDEAGPNDIDSLKMVMDDSDYTWVLRGSQLIKNTQKGENWYGSTSFVMAGGEDFPESKFKVELIDRAGTSGSYYWFLSRNSEERPLEAPPNIDLKRGTIKVEDSLKRSWMMLFYQENILLEQKYISSGSYWSLPQRLKEPGVTLYLLYIDPSDMDAWKAGPYKLN